MVGNVEVRLYGIDAPEITRDLQKMDADCVAFEADYINLGEPSGAVVPTIAGP